MRLWPRIRARWLTWRNREYLRGVARKIEKKMAMPEGTIELSIDEKSLLKMKQKRLGKYGDLQTRDYEKHR